MSPPPPIHRIPRGFLHIKLRSPLRRSTKINVHSNLAETHASNAPALRSSPLCSPPPHPYRTYLLPDAIKSLTLQSSLLELNITETRNKKMRPAVRASSVHGNDRGRLNGDNRAQTKGAWTPSLHMPTIPQTHRPTQHHSPYLYLRQY